VAYIKLDRQGSRKTKAVYSNRCCMLQCL